jgi:hypothetical protein
MAVILQLFSRVLHFVSRTSLEESIVRPIEKIICGCHLSIARWKQNVISIGSGKKKLKLDKVTDFTKRPICSGYNTIFWSLLEYLETIKDCLVLAVLPRLSCPACPVFAVMFRPSSPFCPSRLSCPGYPVLAVLPKMSCLGCPVPCLVLAVMYRYRYSSFSPFCPADQSDLCRLTFPVCPSQLSWSRYPVVAVLP